MPTSERFMSTTSYSELEIRVIKQIRTIPGLWKSPWTEEVIILGGKNPNVKPFNFTSGDSRIVT